MEFSVVFLLILTSAYAQPVSDTPAVTENKTELNKNQENTDNVKWRQSVCVIYGEKVLASMSNRHEDNGSQSTGSDQSPVRLISPMVFESLNVWGHSWPKPSDAGNLRVHTLSLEDRVHAFEQRGNALYEGKREGQNLVITPMSSVAESQEAAINDTKIVDSPVIATISENLQYLGEEYPICTNYEEIKTGPSQGNVTIYKARSPQVSGLSSTTSEQLSQGRQWMPAFKIFRKREAAVKFSNHIFSRGEAPWNSAPLVEIRDGQELQELSHKFEDERSGGYILRGGKSIQSVENSDDQGASETSANGPMRNFPAPSALFKRLLQNSSLQLSDSNPCRQPVSLNVVVHSGSPSSSSPGENQMSSVFNYFFRRTETEQQGDNDNVVNEAGSEAQSPTTDCPDGVDGYQTTSEASTNFPEIIETSTNVPSTETTPESESSWTDAIPVRGDLPAESTDTDDGSSIESIQASEDSSTEADQSTEPTEIAEMRATEASQILEDSSTESTEIPSTEVTGTSEFPWTETSTESETFSTEESSSFSTEETWSSSTIAEDVASDLSTTEGSETTVTAPSDIDTSEPSPTEETGTTEPAELVSTENPAAINIPDEILSADFQQQNTSQISAKPNGEIGVPDVSPLVQARDPQQASEAIADAIDAYEADGSPAAVERLQEILEATANITGDVEDPDSDEDSEDDA